MRILRLCSTAVVLATAAITTQFQPAHAAGCNLCLEGNGFVCHLNGDFTGSGCGNCYYGDCEGNVKQAIVYMCNDQ